MACLADRFYYSSYLSDFHDWLLFSTSGRHDFREHDAFTTCTNHQLYWIYLYYCFCLPDVLLFGGGCCSFGQLLHSLFPCRNGSISSLVIGGYVGNYNYCLRNW